jgi:hypothetical protein
MKHTISRNDWSWETTDLALIHTFEETLNTIIADHLDPTDPKVQRGIYKFIDRFMNTIKYKTTPNDEFPFIASGSYKECYESGIPGWIVKFATVSNRTGAEQQILNAARDFQVSQLFLPTYFIALPFYLDSYYIDRDDAPDTYDSERDTYVPDHSYDPEVDYEPHWFDCMIIQPEAIPQSDLPYESFYIKEAYEEAPVQFADGTDIPYDCIWGTRIESMDWLRAVINSYGDDMFLNMYKFINEFDLTDLRCTNIGYLKRGKVNYPIILDWLSRD